MSPVSKSLRVGAGESSSRKSSCLAKLKAKKGFKDEDYHGYFIEKGVPRQFTTYSGVRYVHPQPIVLRNSLTTIGCINVQQQTVAA